MFPEHHKQKIVFKDKRNQKVLILCLILHIFMLTFYAIFLNTTEYVLDYFDVISGILPASMIISLPLQELCIVNAYSTNL